MPPKASYSGNNDQVSDVGKCTIVIGAGVIGLTTALYLLRQGRKVIIIDRDSPGSGASGGNAGAFAFSDIMPLASPGMLKKAPRWLFDPLGPLSIPPRYALRIAPWMFRFWRACASDRVAKSAIAQASLMALSKLELEPFLAWTKTTTMLRRKGNLEVYEGERQFRASLPGWRLREKAKIEFRHLTAVEMAEIQPGISRQFTHATFTPGWCSIAEPKDYILQLCRQFLGCGGQLIKSNIVSISDTGESARAIAAGGQVYDGNQLVLCAGAFSHFLTRELGECIPLETERGYNTTVSSNAFDLKTQITFGGHGFVVTSLASGIRVGGAVELGGLDLPPNFKRSDVMLTKVQRFLPGFRGEGGTQWMGFRPSLPDSLPVICRSFRSPRIIYAFGHGHLGLTQSVGTARLVVDLIMGQSPVIDLAPFSSRRF